MNVSFATLGLASRLHHRAELPQSRPYLRMRLDGTDIADSPPAFKADTRTRKPGGRRARPRFTD